MSSRTNTIHATSHRGSRPHRRLRLAHRGRHARGFSLVELVTVIVVVGIIFSLGSVVLGRIFSSYALKQNATDADWQAKVALERMTRDLRMVNSPTNLVIVPATAITFSDTDGNTVTYSLSGNSLMRNSQALADNVNALNFSYWAYDGSATTVVASVYYITASMTVQEGGYSAPFRATAHPRNF